MRYELIEVKNNGKKKVVKFIKKIEKTKTLRKLFMELNYANSEGKKIEYKPLLEKYLYEFFMRNRNFRIWKINNEWEIIYIGKGKTRCKKLNRECLKKIIKKIFD